MNRKYVDCREMPNEMGCSLRISGREDEVFNTAIDHAMNVHREKDTPEFRETIRRSLKDEPDEQDPSRFQSGRPGSERYIPPSNLHA